MSTEFRSVRRMPIEQRLWCVGDRSSEESGVDFEFIRKLRVGGATSQREFASLNN
jgi:hypothetical protein